jgi:3-oxoacyl-[acyl-carrier-protein] synthase II
MAVRATGSMLGHGVEAAFPANLALAALALSKDGFYPPFEASEAVASGPVSQIMVSGFGQRRGEAVGLLERS